MSAQLYPTRVTRRFMILESGAWGVLSMTNTAFVSPLLLAHGAGPLAFGYDNSAVNPFGLSPRAASNVRAIKLIARQSLPAQTRL